MSETAPKARRFSFCYWHIYCASGGVPTRWSMRLVPDDEIDEDILRLQKALPDWTFNKVRG